MAGPSPRPIAADPRPEPAPASTPGPVLVLGIGSDLRADDGAGLAVVRAVRAVGLPWVKARWTVHLVPELALPIGEAGRVIFVDAALVPRVRVTRARPAPGSLGCHHGRPEALLGLVQLIGLPVPEAFVVAVCATDLGLGTQLSADTEAAVGTAARLVVRLCAGGPRPG